MLQLQPTHIGDEQVLQEYAREAGCDLCLVPTADDYGSSLMIRNNGSRLVRVITDVNTKRYLEPGEIAVVAIGPGMTDGIRIEALNNGV